MESDDSDFETRNNVFQVYSEAVDLFQQTEPYFQGNKERDYPKILQELKICCSKIDYLISLETDDSSSFFLLALFQQKQQLNTLCEAVEKMQHDLINKHVDNFYPFETPINCKRANSALDIRNPKKQKCEDSDNFINIISNTEEIPKVSGLSEIIGLREVKKTLKSLVILPRTQPQLFSERRICNTILLFGPPGTGKTRLVHALAAESQAVFHCITASDVLSHYVGQTEKTIKKLFGFLKNSYNFSILFMDEIDSFCRRRSDTEQEHSRRIKTELMCQLSDIEDCRNVFIICATNCPWDLDSAILRRFQKRIYVPLPDQLERSEFFEYFTKNAQIEDFENWTALVEKTKGFSGSDLSDLVQSAFNIPITELEDTKIWKCSEEGYYEPVLEGMDFSNVVCSELSDLPANCVKARRLRMADFLNATDQVSSTVSPEDVKKYDVFSGIR